MVNEYIKKQLRNYLARVKEFGPVGKNTGFKLEQNTTIKFVIPLLNILGWDHLKNDMGFEYPVRGRKEKKKEGRCDIALYTDYPKSKKPKVLVEIKRIQVPEEKLESGRYLLEYLNATKINYGIFTDGKELKLVDRRTPTRSHPEGLFSLEANHFLDYPDVLWMLSKEMVSKGKLDEFAHAYHFEPNFFKWAKSEKTGDVDPKKYKLRLEFTRRFLKKEL